MDMATAAVASASIPAVFPALIWEGKGVFLDGGTNKGEDLEAMVEQCLEIVESES